MVMELLIHLKSKISSSFLETVLKPSAVMTYKKLNTTIKSFSFRRKKIEGITILKLAIVERL